MTIILYNIFIFKMLKIEFLHKFNKYFLLNFMDKFKN